MTEKIKPLMVIDQMHNWMMRLFLVAALFLSSPTIADVSQPAMDEVSPKAEFEVSPSMCVTLRQGQPCFVRIRFEWRSKEAVQVCLHDIEGLKIKCWQSSVQGSIVLPQTLPNTTEYLLVDAEGLELNRASVSVSWVYRKKRSKRRWRLF